MTGCLRAARPWLCAALLLSPVGAAAQEGDSAAARPAGHRLTLTGGCEVEALREAFGFASFFDAAGDGAIEVAGARYRDHRGEARALLGLDWEAPAGRSWSAEAGLDARAGSARRSIQMRGEARRDSAALRGLRLRHHLLLDEQRGDDAADDLRSAQSLLQLEWNPGGRGAGRDLVLRGSSDLSRAQTGGAAGDTALALYADFLDYSRFTLGAGLESGGLNGSFLGIEATRRLARSPGANSSWAATLEWRRSRWSLAGSLDLEARLQRRRYDASGDGDSLAAVSSALPSYDEAEVAGRITRRLAFAELSADLRLTGDLYRRRPAEAPGDSLLPILMGDGLDADRLRLEAQWLLRRELLDREDLSIGAPAGRRWAAGFSAGAGATADLLWTDGGGSDSRAGGLRVECRGRGGSALGEAWLETGVEIGRRLYPGERDALVFAVGEATFSLLQTDFTYLELSIVGGGRLPWALRWEGSAFLTREAHGDPGDDISLFSLRVALLREWALAR